MKLCRVKFIFLIYGGSFEVTQFARELYAHVCSRVRILLNFYITYFHIILYFKVSKNNYTYIFNFLYKHFTFSKLLCFLFNYLSV